MRGCGIEKPEPTQPSPGVVLRTIMEAGAPEIDWLVESIIPVGGAIELFGKPGSRKTFLGMQFLVSVVTGVPFLDKFPVQHTGSVLFVQAELTESELRYRFAPLCASYPDILDHVWMPQALYGNIDLPEHWHLVERMVRDTQPSLALFDPFSLMMSGDPNDQKDTLKLLKLINELRFKYNTTVMLIHHPRKVRFDNDGDSVGDGMESSGGSRSIIEWAGSIMRLTRVGKTDKQRLIFDKGRAQDLPDLDLRWDDTAKMFQLDGNEQPLDAQIAVVTMIGDGTLLAAEWHARVARMLGVSRSKTQALLHSLVTQGLIEFVDDTHREIRRSTVGQH